MSSQYPGRTDLNKIMFSIIIQTCISDVGLVQQPSRHFYLNLAKIPTNQVNADFGRGSSAESESE